MQLDMKNTHEVLDAIIVTCDAAQSAAGDGKINYLDLPKLLAPMRAISDAAKDAGQIRAEFKDMDQAEVQALVEKATLVASKVVETVAKMSAA